MKSLSTAKSAFSHRNLLLCTFAITLIFASLLLILPKGIAYAENEAEVLFPSSGYIQTSSPNLISANNDYLLVFDNSLNKLFVRSTTETEDYTYNLNFDEVNQVLAVKNSAFISADEKYYILNLLDKNAEPSEITIPSPVPSKKSSLSVVSDGTYIYAKSVAGCISVYNEDLTIAFSMENEYEDILTGKCVFTAKADTVYTFSSNGGTPFFNSYQFGNEEPTEAETGYYVQQAFAGNVIFAEAESSIIIIDPTDGSCLKETEITPDSFCATGSLLYTVEGSVISVYTFDKTGNELTLISSISMSGSDNKHLNSPKDILKTPDMTVVADSANNRVGFISGSGTMETTLLSAAPLRLCSATDSVYALCENDKVYKITAGSVSQEYAIDDALDITYLDKLYALKNDGVYTLIGGRFVKFLTLSGGKFIASAKDGKTIYVLTDTEIKMITKDACLLNTTLSGLFENATSIEVDYAGNIYLLENNKIFRYTNKLYSLEKDSEYKLNSNLVLTPVSFALDGENIYVSCSECIILKDSLTSVTKETYSENELSPDESPFFYGEKINPDALMTDLYGNPDSARKSPDYALMIYGDVKNGENMVLAKTKDGFFIVNINDYKKLDSKQNVNLYKTKETTEGFTDLFSSPAMIPAETELTAIYQQSVDGTVYIRTSYNNIEYFVKISSLDLIQEIEVDPQPKEPAEPQKKTARIKSSRIGSKVNIYLNPSENSPVILQLVDGKKVDVLSENGDYCLISYDGNEGYILTSSLQFKGLTTIQTVAIILSVVVLIAGTVISLSFYWQKKKNIN